MMKGLLLENIYMNYMEPRKAHVYEGNASAIEDYFNPQKEQVKEENWGYFDKNNNQHRYITVLLRNANIVVKNQRWGEVADMEGWFNRFLKSNKSPVKKPLKKMTPGEVSKIIIALEGVALWRNSI